MSKMRQIWQQKAMFLSVLVVVSILVVSPIVFQNCAGPLELEEQDEASFAARSPFAYHLKFDHIAHMSCSNMPAGFDPEAYFSYRVGAYGGDSGLQLSKAFLDHTEQLPAADRSAFLDSSERNAGTQPQFAQRQRSNMQSVFTGGGAGAENLHYMNMLDNISAPHVADRLVQYPEGQGLKFIPQSLIFNPRMEASIFFGQAESRVTESRSLLANQDVLAVTFTNLDGGFGARSPAQYEDGNGLNARQIVYGIGFNANFIPYANGHPQRILDRVQQVNLDSRSGAQSASWTCPSNMRFMIYRIGDTGCRQVADPPESNMTSRQRRVRKILRVEHWYIDWANSCIIPKTDNGQCYGTNISSVRYGTAACEAPQNNSGAGIENACPHHVSICHIQ